MKITMRDLVSEIARREGKKVQVSIGNLREVLGILSDLFVCHPSSIYETLFNNGLHRQKTKSNRRKEKRMATKKKTTVKKVVTKKKVKTNKRK